jgi:hypothetical protein
MNTHKRTIAVISPPRLDGERNPSMENIIVTSVIDIRFRVKSQCTSKLEPFSATKLFDHTMATK